MRGMDCGESSACGMHAYGNHCCYKKLVVSFTTTELDRRSSSVVPEVSLNLIKFRTVSADFHSFVDAIEFLAGVRTCVELLRLEGSWIRSFTNPGKAAASSKI